MRGQNVYRARITGPEVFLLDMVYCANSTAFAEYRLGLPGRHHLEILHLYESFRYGAHPLLLPEYRIVSAFIDIVDLQTDRLQPCPAGTWSLCSVKSRGRWVVESIMSEALRETCALSSELHPCGEDLRNISLSVDRLAMHWQPHHCSLLQRAQQNIKHCLVNRHICFVGDSHMRHAFNGYVAVTEGGGLYDPYWSDAGGKYVFTSVQASFITDVWGEAVDIGVCTDVIRNFGQWPASFQAGPTPWNAHQYLAQLQKVAHGLLLAREQGKQGYWMTINSMMLTHDRPGQEWRTDPQLLLFNSLAWHVMRHASIPVIDTWSITAPVAELSYDPYHFKGHVGYAIVLQIIEAVCAVGDAQSVEALQR